MKISIYSKIGILLIILGTMTFLFAIYYFTFQGKVTTFFKTSGEISFVAWVPITLIGCFILAYRMIINWVNQNEKSKYTEQFLLEAYKGVLANKTEILKSKVCGCIVCLEVFTPLKISEWVVESDGNEETAVCPKCKMDCVLSSEFPVENKVFLKEMHSYFISNQTF